MREQQRKDMLEIGTLLNGTYKILSVVGRGGMSVVYLAINERANKTWAVKEVRKDGVSDFEVVKQGLIVETEMLKQFNHPHLPSIVDVIDTEDSFIIVMDYIQGKSLEEIITKSGNAPQKKEDVMEWAKQLCDVLGYLHSREKPIIYRDMKPANVMLRPDGNVMLIDFGTAREFKSRSVADTVCLGTRGYAAPEQYGGMGQTDARTDIYCLGATLYHLLTGHSPADPPYEIRPIGEWIPEYAGSGLEEIIIKCTKQDPNERYQNCAELMYALEHEEDTTQKARRDRKRTWRVFVACTVIWVLGAIGMIGFRTGWNHQVQMSYEAYLDNAKNASDLESAADYYTKAIAMDPGKEDAYKDLLSALDRDYEITSEESILLTKAVMHTEGGKRTSIDALKAGNCKAYDELCYRIASDYYFFYEGADNRVKAASWYEKVLDSKNLTAQQLQIANSLHKIGSYYASLGTSAGKYDFAEQGSTYLDYWKDLVDITSGNLSETTGHAYVALGLCKNMAVEIYDLAPQFKAAGVTMEELQEQLSHIREQLAQIKPEDEEDQNEADLIQKNVEQAETIVKSTYAAVEKRGE